MQLSLNIMGNIYRKYNLFIQVKSFQEMHGKSTGIFGRKMGFYQHIDIIIVLDDWVPFSYRVIKNPSHKYI